MPAQRRRTSRSRLHQEHGAAMVEYAFLIVFIALVALVGVTALGVNVNNFFGGVTL